MYQVVIVFHALLAFSIIGLVLMQQGKGADAGAAFGGGASGTLFGASGASSFLSRTTGILAALFFCTSLGLAMLGDTRENVDIMSTPVEDKKPAATPTTVDIPSDLPASGTVTIAPTKSADAGAKSRTPAIEVTDQFIEEITDPNEIPPDLPKPGSSGSKAVEDGTQGTITVPAGNVGEVIEQIIGVAVESKKQGAGAATSGDKTTVVGGGTEQSVEVVVETETVGEVVAPTDKKGQPKQP